MPSIARATASVLAADATLLPLGCYDAYGDVANNVVNVNASWYSAPYRCRQYWCVWRFRGRHLCRTHAWTGVHTSFPLFLASSMVQATGIAAVGFAAFNDDASTLECACFHTVPDASALIVGAAAVSACSAVASDPVAPLACGALSSIDMLTSDVEHPIVLYQNEALATAIECEDVCRVKYARPLGAGGAGSAREPAGHPPARWAHPAHVPRGPGAPSPLA